MSKPTNEAFIDTNIIFAGIRFNGTNILPLIFAKYDRVFIHAEVLLELRKESERDLIIAMINNHKIVLFDPVNLFPDVKKFRDLASYELADYNAKAKEIDQAFNQVDKEKGSNNIGEIYSLAASHILNTKFICSNDNSIEKVIRLLNLSVLEDPNDEESNEVLIHQDRLLDICLYIVTNRLLNRKTTKKFFKVAINGLQRQNFDRKVAEFDKLIP